ncbi:hypothetical protein ACQ4PT_062401 [Festuca glaucescens]
MATSVPVPMERDRDRDRNEQATGKQAYEEAVEEDDQRGPAQGDGHSHQQQKRPVKKYNAKTPSAQVHSAHIPSATVSSHTECLGHEIACQQGDYHISADLRAEAFLTKIWVKMFDVPGCLRKSELLLEGTKMIGRPHLVDDESLTGDGPMCMLFHSHAPTKLPPSVLLLANMQGFRIRLVSSLMARGDANPPPPPPPPSKYDDDDEETEDQSKSEPHLKRVPTKVKYLSKDKAVSSKEQTSPQNKDGEETQEKEKGDKVASESICTFKKGYYKVGARKLPNFGLASPVKGFSQEDSGGTRASPIHVSSQEVSEDKRSPPPSPSILKRSKMSAEGRSEVGWESPVLWEKDNETLASRITKLKKRQNGEVKNHVLAPPSSSISKNAATPRRRLLLGAHRHLPLSLELVATLGGRVLRPNPSCRRPFMRWLKRTG